MACACSKGRRARSAAGTTYQYEFTPPEGDTVTYINPIEAKRELRKHGGGEIRRVAVPAPSASTVPS
jgi:hypothetical protein